MAARHTKQARNAGALPRWLLVSSIAAAFLVFSVPALGGSFAEDDTYRYNLGLFTLNADPFAVPESVDVQVPSHVSSDLEAGLSVFVNMPFGCYGSRIKVDHIDDYTHRLTPILIADDKACVPNSRFDHQVVSLGRLAPGRHEIVVENTVRPFEARTLWVTEANLSASN